MIELARAIEHTLLNPAATEDDIVRLCQEALRYGFRSVCVNPRHASFAKAQGVRVASVVGFPLGATLTSAKACEARALAAAGVQELDMVMDLGAAKAGRWDQVEADIRAVVGAAPGCVHKVILECCFLTDGEKALAAGAALRAGAAFLKTSTGFGPAGATARDVRLLVRAAGGRAGVKAAGGIRTRAQAMEMLGAGASLIGTSSGVEMMAGEGP